MIGSSTASESVERASGVGHVEAAEYFSPKSEGECPPYAHSSDQHRDEYGAKLGVQEKIRECLQRRRGVLPRTLP